MERKLAHEKSSLQPPGAGLPLAQRVFLKLYVGPFVSKRAKWEASQKMFEGVNAKVLKIIEGLSSEQLSKRTLVCPLPGIEDSSRYWSVAMCLEHMMIVAHGIKAVLIYLGNETPVPVKVDIAKYKPMGEASPQEIVAEFKKFSQEFMSELVPQIKNQKSKTKHDHPWFGAFSLGQWFWLLGAHSGIHYRQIKEIKKGLGF